MNEYSREEVLSRVSNYLHIRIDNLHNDNLIDNIKELCVMRLCKSIGIWCDYNYKSPFFEFFAEITGEAVCIKLHLPIHVARDNLRLIKYEHINLIDETYNLLNEEDIDQSFINCFNFIDRFKYLVL